MSSDDRSDPAVGGSAELWFDLTRERDLIGQLIDHTITLSIEAQTWFAERYAGLPWRVDLQEPAVFWFERQPPAMFRPHFVGSSSLTTNTWMWGWHNINGLPDDVIDVALRIHQAGEQLGIVELTTAHQSLEQAHRVAQGLIARDTPEHVYVYCAQAVAGLAAPVYYRAPHGSGFSWFLLDNAHEFRLPIPTALSTTTAITRALQNPYVTDHRLAVTAYAHRREGIYLRDGEPRRMVLQASDQEVAVGFDAAGRVRDIAT